MSKLAFSILITLFFPLAASTSWSIENYGIGSPIGSATIPQSSYRGGLYRSPNPIDTSTSQVVTGNVRYGRYFRQALPYSSPSSFQATLGSTDLDAFMRDSVGSEIWRRRSGTTGYQPYEHYYSQTQTVATTVPGRPGVFDPSGSRIDGRVPDIYGLEPIVQQQVPYKGFDSGLTSPTIGQAMPERTDVLADTGEAIAPTRLRDRMLVPGSDYLARNRYQAYQTKPDLTRDLQETDVSRENLTQPDAGLNLKTDHRTTEDPGRLLEPVPDGISPKPVLTEQQSQRQTGRDVLRPDSGRESSGESPLSKVRPLSEMTGQELLEQVRRQLSERPSQALSRQTSQSNLGQASVTSEQAEGESTGQAKSFELYGSDTTLRRTTSDALTGEQKDVDRSSYKQPASVVEQVNGMSEVQLRAEARKALGPYRDIETYTRANFTRRFQEAVALLREGKYYRAADVFAMCSIYIPDHPAVYVGRAVALFGAGEYMSSSLFLARAFEAKPEYARTKIDLAGLLGGPDKVEKRITEVEYWLKHNQTGELDFLLAYVYYRIDRLDKAKAAIDAAAEKMSTPGGSRQWRAVDALREAIAARGELAEPAAGQSQQPTPPQPTN
jgi:tetratricopeptide (TPR) repeat protein